ncbi:MAG: hypothetical protein A3G24_26885 [Betaproteobacteria bacterium RIFCSPLOWO2_12_FULL_62_13]|nr:MAG: hypothetical protein A3G24_26885 [Betaproteobacteria bacterium RIFCSPLOWO2_12_FULL_62_13]
MRLNEIYEELKDRVQFYCVYIQEAHPTDGRQSAQNLVDGILYEQPKSIKEREELAQVCVLRLNLKMPMLLDDMSNEVDRLYAALPDRLYLLDENGVVVFRTVVGSPGFDVDAWYAAIRGHVGAPGASLPIPGA